MRNRWRNRVRPGSAAGGQCTLTGDSSFWRATMNACARSGTSASTAPFGGVDRVEVVEAAGARAHRLGEVGGLHLADVDDALLAVIVGETGEIGHLCLLRLSCR